MKTLQLQNWKFSLDTHIDPWAPGFDDSSWQDVIVPHDWAVGFPFSRKYSSGTGYLPGGTGWYRARFSVDKGQWEPGKKAFISFDGVYKNSQVWVNGYYLGRRPSGYAGFRYDISHCLREGENTAAVKVSHEEDADSRWYTGSGIYRKVTVEFHDPVYVKAESVIVKGGESGFIVVGLAVNDGAVRAEDLRVVLAVEGENGENFTAETEPPALAGGASVPFSIHAAVTRPRLWSDAAPNLYKIRLKITAKSGGAATSYSSPVIRAGIRTFRFDPDKGFFINGESRKLKGVCVHHDAGCLGAAVRPEVWRRRLAKLKEAGCNAIRASHNPHMPELYDLCDEMGFFVMEEAFDEWEGCKNKWTQGHNVYPPAHQGYYEDFPQWHERDLADMVIRGRNHPSIIMWSIGNEIDYPNDPYAHPLFEEMTGNNDADKPKAERVYNPRKPNMERLAVIAAELVSIIKRYDAERPVLAAAAFPELSSRIGFLDALDMAGYNYKEQFYEADHRRFPNLPLIGSENGHHLEAWKAVRDHDYISGQFLWTGIDYLGEARGWPVRGSGAGILDAAGNEKIAYYRRRALWSGKPTLYLAACPASEGKESAGSPIHPWELFRSWNAVPGAAMNVVCYTNLDSAELFLNGKSLGSRRKDDSADYLLWEKIPFERGALEARSAGGPRDALESTLPAVRFRLTRWEQGASPAEEPSGAHRFSQVELELLDEKDRLVTTENPLVHFALEGEGKLLGIENGDLADCAEYSAPRRRVYRGRLIAYVLGEKAVLSASAEGFPRATLAL